VAVVDNHFSAAFAARDLRDEGSDMGSHLRPYLPYDRDSVAHIANKLLPRIARENVGTQGKKP